MEALQEIVHIYIITGSGGAGGSGYISGMSGCDSVKSVNDSTPTGSPFHYSGYYFTDCTMISGNNVGNGKVIITPQI